MRIIGFNFTKIKIERLKDTTEELKIKTEIDIPELKELKSSPLNTKEEVIEIKFLYRILYEPGFAIVELEGKLLMALEPKTAKEVVKQWKKKKMPEDFRVLLFNAILKKSVLKALELEDELNLPLHMPMPTFRRQEEE